MVAWMLRVFAAPVVLAGFGVYLCRGPRHRRLTRAQIAESEIPADLDGRENWKRRTPDHQRPGRLPAPGTAARASPAPGSADLARRRQLEKPVAWSGRERLRCLRYRLRLLADMNYASRRLVELQIPRIAGPQWHVKPNPPSHAEPACAPARHPHSGQISDIARQRDEPGT